MTPLVPGANTNGVKITRHNGLPEPMKTSERPAYKYRYIGRPRQNQSSTSQTFGSVFRHLGTLKETRRTTTDYTRRSSQPTKTLDWANKRSIDVSSYTFRSCNQNCPFSDHQTTEVANNGTQTNALPTILRPNETTSGAVSLLVSYFLQDFYNMSLRVKYGKTAGYNENISVGNSRTTSTIEWLVMESFS